jgi:DNA-binding IclR family transcriptional regulator
METLTTVEKAIDVLFHLHSESGARGVTAISRALGMPKSSTHRLLSALSRRALLEKDDRGRYRPGVGLVALGLGALDREPVVAAARPVLEAEADALDETVFLVVARAGRIIVLDKAEGSGFLRAAPRIGATVPVHATAVGKLYLAFGRGAIATPRGALERFSDDTLTDLDALNGAVFRAAECGYAANIDEWIPGLSVVAAPVLDPRAKATPGLSVVGAPNFATRSGARMLAGLAMAASTPRMRSLGVTEVGHRLITAAGRITARLAGASS